MTIGEVVNGKGERWELQLKGAGKTPYSRRADGRAVLRSSLREYVASEAMHALGVPTTRALSLVATNDKVLRDMFYDGNAKMEPGAVVCRVAPSFVRIGTFELPASRRQDDLVKQLFDYVVRHHYKCATTQNLPSLPSRKAPIHQLPPPVLEDIHCSHPCLAASSLPHQLPYYLTKRELEGEPEAPALFLQELSRRTARMAAAWQSVGFVHGVLNTDNTSVLGLTIDYGPYGWMEGYDPMFTPNTTDFSGRRYCFAQQPNVLYWNLQRLSAAFESSGLVSAEAGDAAVDLYVTSVHSSRDGTFVACVCGFSFIIIIHVRVESNTSRVLTPLLLFPPRSFTARSRERGICHTNGRQDGP